MIDNDDHRFIFKIVLINITLPLSRYLKYSFLYFVLTQTVFNEYVNNGYCLSKFN